MRNIFKILSILFFVSTVINCGNNKNSDSNSANLGDIQSDSETLDMLIDNPKLYASVISFKSNEEEKDVITEMLIFQITCSAEFKDFCNEISPYITYDTEIPFTGLIESFSTSNYPTYELKVHGPLKIGEKLVDATLFYNIRSDKDVIEFFGEVVFNNPYTTEPSEANKLTILVKGKKQNE